ncbi:hypothetical protein DPMN_008179, partial [Dreissena polymorpha]
NVFQQTGTIFELVQDIIGTNLLKKFHEDPTINVASTVLTRILPSNIKKTAPPTGGHVFPLMDHVRTQPSYPENTYWTKNVTSRVFTCFSLYDFSPIWTIFEHVRDINKTYVLTKFHDDWAKIVTSRVNTAPPGGHLHEDWASNVTSTVFTSFELSRGINGTTVLTKFHEDRTIHVASGVFTRQMLTTHDGQKAITKAHHEHSSAVIWDIIGTKLLTKFQEDRKINVASRVLTRKNAPPAGSHFHEDWTINVTSRVHVFQAKVTIFELIQDISGTNLLTKKNAPPPGSHVFQTNGIIFDLFQDIIGMNLLTKFYDDQTITVASRVLTIFYYSHILP